jgi:hypothetical protein
MIHGSWLPWSRILCYCADIRDKGVLWGNSFELKEGLEKGTEEAREYLAGEKKFRVFEIEVF